MRFPAVLRPAVLIVLVAILSKHSLCQFETRASFPIATSVPISAVVADFNRDGIADAAVVNYLSPSSIEILLGNGDGTFRSRGSYPVGNQPFYAAASSLRGNGILDLVVGDTLSADVYVMLGNGDGTFKSAAAYPTTGRSTMVSVGDFTGDGKVDVLALEGYDCYCVEVLPGNGDGTLGSPISTPLPYGLGGYAVAVADFNADGKLDLAVSGEAYPDYIVAVLLGNGNGTFAANGSYTVSAAPLSLASGSFTGDPKKIDLAVANFEGNSLSVLLGNGDGSFQQPVFYTTPSPTWVTAANLDSDGKIDLAVANFGDVTGDTPGVTVFRGKGDGTFRLLRFYPAGKEINYVASADFNGDHRPDLLPIDSLGYDAISLLNTGVVSFSPTTPLNFKKQAVGTTSNPQNVTLTNAGSQALRIASMKASVEFAVTSTCGSSVAAGANCTISATFSPTTKGKKTGTITIIDSASTKPQAIELAGTGT